MDKKLRLGELLIRLTLILFAVVSILVTAGIVLTLGEESLRFFASGQISVWKFFTATKWQPAVGEYGILPLFSATLMTSLIAMLIAAPLGLFVAVYLS
jgi:phosphate transport system permease protein